MNISNKKPSERIKEIAKELKEEFDGKQPYFFLDNGYEPNFKEQAIIKYLDEQFENKSKNIDD